MLYGAVILVLLAILGRYDSFSCFDVLRSDVSIKLRLVLNIYEKSIVFFVFYGNSCLLCLGVSYIVILPRLRSLIADHTLPTKLLKPLN